MNPVRMKSIENMMSKKNTRKQVFRLWIINENKEYVALCLAAIAYQFKFSRFMFAFICDAERRRPSGKKNKFVLSEQYLYSFSKQKTFIATESERRLLPQPEWHIRIQPRHTWWIRRTLARVLSTRSVCAIRAENGITQQHRWQMHS